MKLRNNTRRILIIILAITLAFGGLFALAGCKSPEPTVDLNWEETCVWHTLSCTDYYLEKQVSLEERQDENGNPYVVGVLGDELDGKLKDLVDTYNADPSTDKMATVDEVRHDLTEGIVEFCTTDNTSSPTLAFLLWCGDPADLEYKLTTVDGITGALLHTEGDPANPEGSITNYSFVTGPRSYPDLRYTWQETGKATAGN